MIFKNGEENKPKKVFRKLSCYNFSMCLFLSLFHIRAIKFLQANLDDFKKKKKNFCILIPKKKKLYNHPLFLCQYFE